MKETNQAHGRYISLEAKSCPTHRKGHSGHHEGTQSFPNTSL